MVNGLYLYNAFLVVMITQSAFTLCLIHKWSMDYTNLLIRGELTSYTIGTAMGDILGLSVLPKDTWTCWNQTTNLPTGGRQLYLLSHE